MSLSSKTLTKYVHPELGKEVVFGIAGYYTPLQEGRLPYEGREVLYEIGRVVLESACCGTDQWVYISVPGYVVNWHASESDDGLPVSDIEPIHGPGEREGITRMIQLREGAIPVEFWP